MSLPSPTRARVLVVTAFGAIGLALAAGAAPGCGGSSGPTAYLGPIDLDAAPEVRLGGPDVGPPDAGADATDD